MSRSGPGSGGGSETFDPSGSDRTWVADHEPTEEVAVERYTVVTELGRGAIGIVERVYDAHLDRTVARKRLLADDPHSRRRFVREARITASLAHPGIPPVYDLGIDEEMPYYTMQEIVGRPWRQIVREHSPQKHLDELDTLLTVARAVAHAHERGFVHRDLKLANVMVGPLGDAFVVDWGLCVAVGHEGPAAGTPQYMSPEQARGGPVHPHFDVWTLGVILYRLLTGCRPHDARETSEVVELARVGVIGDPREKNPQAPTELCDIQAKANALDPDRRYPDASAFAADLQAYLRGQVVGAHDYTVRELATRVWQRHRRRLLVALTVTVVAALVTVALMVAFRAERDRAVVAELEALSLRDRALAAQREAVEQLVEALLARAAAAPADRWRPEAELAAAEALTHTYDLPRAWGILARHARADHPVHAWSVEPDCPAESADDHHVVLLCDGTTYLAELSADGRLGPRRPAPGLVPMAPFEERGHHHVAGRLLSRSEPGSERVVDIQTGETVYQALFWGVNPNPIAPGIRDGRKGVVLRSQGFEVAWIPTDPDPETAPRDQVVVLGTVAPHDALAMDGDYVYTLHSNHGVRACHGRPLSCTDVLPRAGLGHLAAGYGVLAVADTRGELLIRPTPRPEQPDPPILRVPIEAGAHTQLAIVEPGFIAGLRSDGDVDLWGLDGKAVARIPGSARRIAGAHGRLLLLGDQVAAWNLGTGRSAYDTTPAGALTRRADQVVSAAQGALFVEGPPRVQGPPPEDVVKDADVTPSGDVVYSVINGPIYAWRPGEAEPFREWDLSTSARRLVSTADGGALVEDYGHAVAKLHPDGQVTPTGAGCWGDMARSADHSVVVCGSDGRLVNLDPQSGVELATLAEHDRALWAIGVAPDGSSLVYALQDHRLVRLDLRTLEAQPPVASGHESFVAAIEYSPDGRFVATASWDQDVRVFDARDLHLLAVLEGHEGRVIDLAFPTPTQLASVGWDARLWHWDLSVLDDAPRAHVDRLRRELGRPQQP